MRIDLTTNSLPDLERSQSSGSSANAATGPTAGVSSNADDEAQLSTSSDAVASLRSQLDAVPDVRQQRVESLRQALSAGQFTISPQRIADGMLAGSAVSV